MAAILVKILSKSKDLKKKIFRHFYLFHYQKTLLRNYLSSLIKSQYTSQFLAKGNSRGLCYKTLQVCNLQEMDRFCCKLVSSGLDKHTSLNKQTNKFTTKSVQ